MKRLQAWLWSPLLALQFLTRFPVPPLPDWLYRRPDGAERQAFVFFPLVGVLVGAAGAGAWTGARALGLSVWTAAVLAVAATALVTGALHEDGLADTCDALGPSTRERALDVMRDSRIGAFGALGLWVLLALKGSALAALPAPALWRTLLCAHVLSCWSSLPLALWLPSARQNQGLGLDMTSLVSGREALPATLLALLLVILLADPRRAMVFLAAAAVTAALAGLLFRRRFGGVTGDCLGAANQAVEVVILLLGSHI